MFRLTLSVAVGCAGALAAIAADPAQYVLVSGRTGNADLVLVDATRPTAEPRNLTNHPARDCYPAWSPDGQRIAFASDRDNAGNIYVVDTDGKNLTQVTREKPGPVRCYCPSWAPDGKRICYGRVEGTQRAVHVINADGTGDRRIVDAAMDPAWAPAGDRIAFAKVGPKGQRLCLCDPDGGHVVELRADDNPAGMTLPAWSPDGGRLAYAEIAGGALELFVINADGTGRRQLTYGQAVNFYPAWSPDGQTILFVHTEQAGTGYMRINADGTRLDISPITMIDRPDRLDFRPAFRPLPRAAKPQAAGEIKLVSHVKEAGPGLKVVLEQRLRAHSAAVPSATLSPDGRAAASVAEDGGLLVYAVTPKGLQPTGGVRAHTAGVASSGWSVDGKLLLTCGRENVVKLWDVEKRDCKAMIHDAKEKPLLAAFAPDGERLAVACTGRVIQIRDVEMQTIETRFELPGADAATLAFSPVGRVLAAGGGDWNAPEKSGTVAAWDLRTGKRLWAAAGTSGGVWGLCYAPDGKTLAAACLDGTVRLWEAKTGKEKQVLRGPADRVISVAYSPDGKYLAATGFDHAVRLWDAATGRPLAVLAGHVSRGLGVGFTPDGQRFLSTGADGTVCLWRIEQ